MKVQNNWILDSILHLTDIGEIYQSWDQKLVVRTPCHLSGETLDGFLSLKRLSPDADNTGPYKLKSLSPKSYIVGDWVGWQYRKHCNILTPSFHWQIFSGW